MQTTSPCGSQGPRDTADLFCTACDSQIGTYENEWVRLTSSYVIPKVIGTKFGIIVAEEHRTVDGKEATALHGCDLSEASCSKCSKAIGHFCRNAPGKSHLVGQYIYKLSKTYLKRNGSSTPVAFNLVFGASQLQQNQARKMFTASLRPVQSSSPYAHGVHNDAPRQSMGPPSSRTNTGPMIDPALEAPIPTPPTNRESSSRSAELTGEEKFDVRGTTLILQRLEEQDNKLSKMSDSMNDWKIQNGKLLAMLMRSHSQVLTQQDTSKVLGTLIDDFEFMVNAAHEARSDNDELVILRAENESMKAKLQTIALAMGSAVRNTPPASQPLASPTAASSTSSVLGKRKRTDARSRLSLLQNEISFTDEDDLDDHSGLYVVSDVANIGSTPTSQLERPLTPLLSGAPACQHLQTPAATNISIAKLTANPIGGGQSIAKTSTQMLTPPDSGFAEQGDRESRSTEPVHSFGVEPEISGDTAPEVNSNVHGENAGFSLDHKTDGTQIMEPRRGELTTTEDPSDDCRKVPTPNSQPQRSRQPTLKIADVNDTYEHGYVDTITEERQKSRVLSTADDMAELKSRETQANAANGSRRKTTSILPEGASSRFQNPEKEQRRNTTYTLPETVSINEGDRDECNRLTRQLWVTRAPTSRMHHVHENNNANGYIEGHSEMSKNLVEANLWRDHSSMSLTNDEEQEELFERHQINQRPSLVNGNNKENELPYYAESADGAQSKQLGRRNRDPNKPKRPRRRPDEIQRRYKCLFPGCTKAYGELPHLNTHITDSDHGERWVKADYLEVTKNQGSNSDYGMDQEGSLDFDRLAEEKNTVEAVDALKTDQEASDQVEKLRQRDRMAKEAMEREEMMELMNGA